MEDAAAAPPIFPERRERRIRRRKAREPDVAVVEFPEDPLELAEGLDPSLEGPPEDRPEDLQGVAEPLDGDAEEVVAVGGVLAGDAGGQLQHRPEAAADVAGRGGARGAVPGAGGEGGPAGPFPGGPEHPGPVEAAEGAEDLPLDRPPLLLEPLFQPGELRGKGTAAPPGPAEKVPEEPEADVEVAGAAEGAGEAADAPPPGAGPGKTGGPKEGQGGPDPAGGHAEVVDRLRILPAADAPEQPPRAADLLQEGLRGDPREGAASFHRSPRQVPTKRALRTIG